MIEKLSHERSVKRQWVGQTRARVRRYLAKNPGHTKLQIALALRMPLADVSEILRQRG